MIACLDFRLCNLCTITKAIHNNYAATLSSAAPHLGMPIAFKSFSQSALWLAVKGCFSLGLILLLATLNWRQHAEWTTNKFYIISAFAQALTPALTAERRRNAGLRFEHLTFPPIAPARHLHCFRRPISP
jgi:hypothetical protein